MRQPDLCSLRNSQSKNHIAKALEPTEFVDRLDKLFLKVSKDCYGL